MRKETKENEIVVTTTMSKAYQITVPSVVRKMLDLKPGDEVEFALDDNGMRLVKALTKEARIKQGFAELERLRIEREKTMTPKQKKIVEMTRGWTINQFHEYFDNLPETQKYLKEKYGVKVA